MVKEKYYAVANGRSPAIYRTWDECKSQVDGFSNAKFKSFSTSLEAEQYMNYKEPTVQIINSHKRTYEQKENWCILQPSKMLKMACNDNVDQKLLKCEINLQLSHDSEDKTRVSVYTDGSCRKGKHGNMAGFGVYWGDNNSLNVGQKYVGVQTNNRAEIAAVINAVETASEHGISKLLVNTDSKFTINCMTKWIPVWKKNNWKLCSSGKNVECRDVLEKLDNLINSTKIDIKWNHVKAHNGCKGNEAADRLALQGANQWIKK